MSFFQGFNGNLPFKLGVGCFLSRNYLIKELSSFLHMYVLRQARLNFSPPRRYMTKLADELKQTSRCDKFTQRVTNGVVSQFAMLSQYMISYKSGIILKDWHKINKIEIATRRIPRLCSCLCFSRALNWSSDTS